MEMIKLQNEQHQEEIQKAREHFEMQLSAQKMQHQTEVEDLHKTIQALRIQVDQLISSTLPQPTLIPMSGPGSIPFRILSCQ